LRCIGEEEVQVERTHVGLVSDLRAWFGGSVVDLDRSVVAWSVVGLDTGYAYRRQKRGGGQELIRLDAEEADARYRLEPAHWMTPEVLFEKRWAHALLEQTLANLRTDFIARGKERLFDGLSSFLTSDLHEKSYQSAADQLGLPLSAIKTTVHRLRRDYREKLREEIGRTVASPEEVDDELRCLRKVLASAA